MNEATFTAGFPFAVLGTYDEQEGPILVDFMHAPTISEAKREVIDMYPDLLSFTLCYIGDSWSYKPEAVVTEWQRCTATEAGTVA
jgi:hypothetical protein